MKKEDLIKTLSEKAGINRKQAQEFIEAFVESMIEGIKRDGRVLLVGFGTFEVVERKGRKGVNPRTGERIEIPPKKVVRFRSGKLLKEAVK